MTDTSTPSSRGPAITPTGAKGRPPARPLVIQVAALRKANGSSRHVARNAEIPGLAAVGVTVPAGSEIVADLELTSYPGGITVTGTVTAPWLGECRRCGGPVGGQLVTAVRERYAPEGGSNQDEDAYPLVGDELDLEPLVRDAVLLELPLAPLCTEDCAGLCPQCGVNRNVSMCECPPAVDPRWSGLDALRDH